MNSWKKTVATIHCVCCILVTTWTLKQRLTVRWGNQCETALERVLVTWRSNQGPFHMCLICIGPVGSPHVCISQETLTMTVSRTIGFLAHIATNHLEWHLVSPILRNPHLSGTCNIDCGAVRYIYHERQLGGLCGALEGLQIWRVISWSYKTPDPTCCYRCWSQVCIVSTTSCRLGHGERNHWGMVMPPWWKSRIPINHGTYIQVLYYHC